MGTPACPAYADRVIPSEVTEAAAFSAFLPTTRAPGPHNSPVRILPLPSPPPARPGPRPPPRRRTCPRRTQDGVARCNVALPLRAHRILGEACGHHSPTRGELAFVSRRPRPARCRDIVHPFV